MSISKLKIFFRSVVPLLRGWPQAGGGNRNIILFCFIIFQLSIVNCQLSFAQEIWIPEAFVQTQGRLNKDGAIALSFWAIGNITYSGIQYGKTSGETQRFHQMGIFWNSANLALAIPKFIRGYKIYKGKVDLKLDLYNPRKYMKQYLFSSCIDLLYIGTGALINGRSSHARDPERAAGFGKSIMVQGGFLLSFDAVMFLLQRKLLKNLIRDQEK
jgi:hypothetical protein